VLTLPPSVRVFLCATPLDLRKSFDGLAAAARELLVQDPLSGHLFVFLNRRANRVKILLWDRNGFWLMCKRLEQGRFHAPVREGQAEIEAAELSLMLEGIDLAGAKRRPRWVPKSSPQRHGSEANDG